MISFKHKGDLSKTTRFLKRAKELDISRVLNRYGAEGVSALAYATPKESGTTASSWYFEIKYSKNSATINFLNSNINKGVPIAIILQYGHGTGTGGWVQGIDYINPAIQPVFDKIADNAWREVTKL